MQLGAITLQFKHTNNKAMEQTDPRRRRTSARLAFADHVDYLVAGQRAPGSPKGTEPLAGLNRRLMARWSCSKTLLRYGTGRCSRSPEAIVPERSHSHRRCRTPKCRARAPPVAPRRLEAADRQTPAARVQDHRPHLDCGAQLRLAWPQSSD